MYHFCLDRAPIIIYEMGDIILSIRTAGMVVHDEVHAGVERAHHGTKPEGRPEAAARVVHEGG